MIGEIASLLGALMPPILKWVETLVSDSATEEEKWASWVALEKAAMDEVAKRKLGPSGSSSP